ncbi:MAG: hypothetical protein AB1330_01205 [Bacillota bacterium]
MDILLTGDGDLVVTNDDLALTDWAGQERLQMAMCRIRTDAPDWFHHPSLGASLGDLYGEPNTQETASLGMARIKEALCFDGYFSPHEVSVEAVPDFDGVHFFVHIVSEDEERPLVYQVKVEFVPGTYKQLG